MNQVRRAGFDFPVPGRRLGIAHVLDTLEIGGAERMVQSLCHAQLDLGHAVSVHALFGGGPIQKELEMAGVAVHVHGPATPAAAAVRLMISLAKSRPNAVHLHNMTATVLGALPARFLCQASVVSTRHGLASRTRYSAATRWRFGVAARFCDRVVAVTDGVRADLIVDGLEDGERLVTIRNCAPMDLPVVERSRDRSGPFTFVSVARLSVAKDHATLLRAFHQARTQMPMRLVLVGDGPLRPELEQLSQELGLQADVTFAGSQTDVVPFLVSADAFVLSSVTEGLPLALLEAMACSLPAVVTSVGGMPEVLELSRAGLVVPPSSPATLAAALLELVRHPNQRELGANARACYEAYFRPRQMAESYLKLYESKRIS
jgi:glycosyltransferase involved in cell wall biosynthesis